MKVLWLAPFPYIDDKNAHPAPWIISLAKLLIENRIELTIVNYNTKIDEPVVKKEYKGIKLIYIKVPSLKLDMATFYILRIKKVRDYLKTIVDDFDLLHIHGSEHQYEVMAKNLGIPTLISIQGIISEVVKVVSIRKSFKIYLEWKLSSLYEKVYLKHYENFSCRTHWDSSYIKTLNPDANIYKVWEIIREAFFSDHFSDQKEYILFVGGKNPIKGLNIFLKAYNDHLQQEGLKLIILGNCTQTDIEEMIKDGGLKMINIENIDCRGIQDTNGMLKAYDDSFCLVHPTLIDNSPNSVCEAQLAGLPVVASDVGGVSSLIEHERTGLLSALDSDQIGENVLKLVKNTDLFKQISLNSREAARKRHNVDIILNQTIDIYNDLIKAGK